MNEAQHTQLVRQLAIKHILQHPELHTTRPVQLLAQIRRCQNSLARDAMILVARRILRDRQGEINEAPENSP